MNSPLYPRVSSFDRWSDTLCNHCRHCSSLIEARPRIVKKGQKALRFWAVNCAHTRGYVEPRKDCANFVSTR